MNFQLSHEVGAKWIFEIQAAFCGFSRKRFQERNIRLFSDTVDFRV